MGEPLGALDSVIEAGIAGVPDSRTSNGAIATTSFSAERGVAGMPVELEFNDEGSGSALFPGGKYLYSEAISLRMSVDGSVEAAPESSAFSVNAWERIRRAVAMRGLKKEGWSLRIDIEAARQIQGSHKLVEFPRHDAWRTPRFERRRQGNSLP